MAGVVIVGAWQKNFFLEPSVRREHHPAIHKAPRVWRENGTDITFADTAPRAKCVLNRNTCVVWYRKI